MTVTKEFLREALDLNPRFLDYETNPAMSGMVRAAARFTERLLPAECRNFFHASDKCPTCHGTGQLWDEGLVEVIEGVVVSGAIAGITDREIARAVLSALTQEVGK